ncbi:MAG: discoidin domain-containing protein, partial [Candidatus Faecousia sp.]|nr:discoidin domain-containing protein [Candidatus Faecousia sp.]
MKSLWKRTLAWFLALAMCLSLVPATYANAEESEQEPAGEASTGYEPWAHGYRFVDILNWDSTTDPYAEELVASVPLQERNETFAATQANPGLMDKAQLYVISSSNYRNTDTTNGPWNGGMAYDEFSYNLFKFWQYADITGAGGRPTSEISSEMKSQIGSFEYGTIAIPIAAATNAAHKNGVLSIGEYFIPRSPQYTEEWLYQDENGDFPYAQKLVDIAKYYGFDGYFINQEESIPSSYVPLFRDMLKWMVDQGLYIQWYDSIGDGGSVSYQNAFNDYNDGWLWNEEDGNVCNSIFLNYWYSSSALKNSKAHAESLGLDPYETVFMGVEGGQWKFGTNIETRYNAVDENGQPYTSFAIWGSDWYQDQYDRTDDQRYQVGWQWGVEERERIYFTSPTENAGTYSSGEVTRNDIDAGTINFQGFSKYVVEKSVINGTTFASDFNNGHGMQYFVNGEVSRDMEWSNLNLQDILPTWQWWIEAEDITVEMDWDYGPEFYRHQGDFPYTQIGAYNGGSSIVIYGDLQDSQLIHLYKTSLNVGAETAISLTYNKPSDDDSSTVKVAVIFEEDPENTYYLPIENSGEKTEGWVTGTVSLGEYAGKTIASIGLELSATEQVEGYQINLGRLVVSDGNSYTPTAPANVALTKRFDETGEIQIAWDLADYDDVINYHVYAVYADDSVRFVGGAYASNYYIQNLENAEDVVALEVRAVGIDGSESAGTRVALASGNRVSGIRTVSADNKLTVTWTDPSEDFASVEVALDYWYSNTTNEAKTATAVKGDQKVVFDIALEDGAQYILSVTTVNEDGTKNETVNFFGDLVDNYCAPYDGEARMESAGKVNMTVPGASDWFTLAMEINGNVTTYKRFGGSMMRRISIPTSGISTMTITVTDIDGNVSEPVTQMFLDGMPANLDDEFGEDMIPDAKLREALQEQAGPTLGDLLDFTGALDLSNTVIKDLTGLNLLTGITELNVSGTFITEITASQIPAGVKKLTVKDCGNLKSIELDNRPNTALVLGYLPELTDLSLVGYGASELDLSGCAKLVNLYLTNSSLETLDITANVKLHNFDISGSKITTLTAADASAYTNAYRWQWDNNLMDLSDNTNEGALKNGIKNYFDTTEIPLEIGKDKVALISHTYVYLRGGNSTVYDLGEEALVAGLDFSLYYYSYYAISSLTVSVSTDGETYTDVVTAEINENSTAIDFPETVSARYVKLTNSSSSAGYFRTMNIMGYVVAPQGFTYGGQKPAVVRDDVQEMTVPADNTSYQLLDLLDASYASTRTLKGNLLSGMTEADWIDAAYLAAQGTAPKGVKVLITDSASNPYEYPIEGPKLGQIEDTKLNVPAETVYANSQYSGEEGYRMFDGSAKSKWCGSEYGNWLVFELEEARVIGQWYTMHAGVEGNGMISAAFRLQTLNTEIVSEEDYLAMSESEKRTIARNASNWVDLDVVTGNTENEVTREIELDSLKQAQVYRFVVDEAAQPDGNSWGALRVYEMELYAYSGQLGANTNGLLKADVMDTYDVSYTKSKVEIANTTVTVRVPTVDEVIALIDAIGTPITVESRDAIKAARVAYENLPEDDQKLVTNYETLEKAEADYLALADAVEALIDEIGYVTLESKAAIEAARAAYDNLTDELKALVANYKTLLDAEQAYAYLTEVDTLVQQAEAAKADAESAKAAAEAAEAAAEAAQASAEAAKAAAAAAAAQAGEDRAAAELAREKAEAAQVKAAAAQAAAETAQVQAEAAATAAQAAQAAAETAKAEAVAAAAEAAASAAAAAQDAAAAAASAEAAATSAAEAAEAAEAAQAAQAAAEAAQAAAEAARYEAETAKAAAEDAAAEAGENRVAAEAAQAKAEAAQAKAEEAQKKAEE